jgi:hypothetical protein
MEQIYYTQCPIGYGLGASNGFQIKRLSAQYPLTSDFRHLGLRAFVPGTKTLAPPALRYRRDGEIAEIAWLTPRSHEYETENGRLWGRPGGQFAHGLRLGGAEFSAIGSWPGGLYGQAFWRRTDPEPTRGRPPDDLALGPSELLTVPSFADVARLAVTEDPDIFARLLTSVAQMVREGRTLFVIDEPDRIGLRVALLTFVVPESMRSTLTFSTYHDRPEELPGFRIQGTIPTARPNRAALMGLGIVADLTTGTFEPRIEPARWATSLAKWLTRHEPDDVRAWTKTCQELAPQVNHRKPDDVIWSDAWLDHLVGFHRVARVPAPRPEGHSGWAEVLDFAGWALQAGIGEAWAAARGPDWWKGIAAEGCHYAEARRALVVQGRLLESWCIGGNGPKTASTLVRAGAHAAQWGEVVAHWFTDADREERAKAVAAFLKAAPAESRAGFLASLIRGLPPEASEEILDRLRANPTFDDAILLPLDAARATRVVADGGDSSRLIEVLTKAVSSASSVVDVLNAVAIEVSDRPDALPKIAPAIADLYDRADGTGWDAAWSWALELDDPAGWLDVYLRRLFAHADHLETWRVIHRRTPRPLRPVFVRLVLSEAMRDGLPDEPFLWGVEEVLLPLPDTDRPHDRAWPDAYLRRVSGLDLARWLFMKDQRRPSLLKWIADAGKRKELSRENVARLKDCQAFALALESGDAGALRDINLPDVPARDRGALLGQILERVGDSSVERINLCLDSCRRAWPGAFDPGALGLEGLALPLARTLVGHVKELGRWFDQLRQILDRLGLRDGPLVGFEPNGLASEIVAATAALTSPEPARWPLRQFLFRRTDAWRILAADARRDLRVASPENGVAVVNHWDDRLDKGGDSARFFELVLNSCSRGSILAGVVTARAADLVTLGILPWWNSPKIEGTADDVREAFAREAPMSPLAEEKLHAIRTWMRRPDPSKLPTFELDGLLEPLADEVDDPTNHARNPLHLSPFALARWRCLEAISAFNRSGLDDRARWEAIRSWIDDRLPMDQLDDDDRHRFLATIILRIEQFDETWIERLARWVVQCGIWDVNRVKDWPGDVAGSVSNHVLLSRYELSHQLRSEMRTRLNERRERRATVRQSESP